MLENKCKNATLRPNNTCLVGVATVSLPLVPRDFSPPAERRVQFQGRIASRPVRVRFDHNTPPVLEDGRGQGRGTAAARRSV